MQCVNRIDYYSAIKHSKLLIYAKTGNPTVVCQLKETRYRKVWIIEFNLYENQGQSKLSSLIIEGFWLWSWGTMVMKMVGNGNKRTFWVDGVVLYFDWGSGYMSVYVY